MRRRLIGKDKFEIQAADLADVQLIAAMAKAVRAKDYAERQCGFLIYALDAEDYAQLIISGHHVGLLLAEEEIVGFFYGSSSSMLKRSQKENGIYGTAHEFALKHAEGNGTADFVFYDQFAILPERQNSGLGSALVELLFLWTGCPIYIDVAEYPLRNPRIKLWEEHGFKRIGEVIEHLPPEFHPIDGVTSITWGIYLRPCIF